MNPGRRAASRIDIRKVSVFAIVVNVMELFLLLGFVAYMILMDGAEAGKDTLRILAVVSALMAGWGAFLDIREAWVARRRVHTIVGLEQANEMMDSLNHKLRAQRHDFLNHLQVVYSLMEMREYEDAGEYLEKVYGEIRSVSDVLRTQSTAVNALLRVKTAALEEAGIAFRVHITSPLEEVLIPAWELCCVLSNLIDNAMDAVKDAGFPEVTLDISENLREFVLVVRNPGEIAPELQSRVFEAGVTTKGEGRGMGLRIVRQTLEERGGRIFCQCGGGETAFTVLIPKHNP